MLLTDKFGRAITDLRISITDRCNYKCVYCRTGNEGAFYGELPFPDYLRMARILVSMGIRKIRLTGGEPLLRKGIVDFVRELRKLDSSGLKPQSVGARCGTAEAVPSRPSASAEGAAQLSPARERWEGNGIGPESRRDDRNDELDIAITTNGHLLADMAQPLKDAGLNRITVSMDAVDPDRFTRITRVPGGFDHVLGGIRAA